MSDLHKHPQYSEMYVRGLRDQRDDWRRIAQTLGYNEAGGEWLEPWCDEHPDGDGQGCVACIGASHDAWMHRAKAAEAEVERLHEALKEIASGPDASKGEDYGCLDLHEARTIAGEALEAGERK